MEFLPLIVLLSYKSPRLKRSRKRLTERAAKKRSTSCEASADMKSEVEEGEVSDEDVLRSPEASASTQSTFDSSACDREAAAREAEDRRTMARWAAEERAHVLEMCKSSKKILMDGYPVYVDQIKTRHRQNMERTSSRHAANGTTWSGMRQAEMDAEVARYQNELSAYENDYRQSLASYNC